jgi:hypothetical protein
VIKEKETIMNWFDVVFMFDFNEGAKLFRLNLQADDAEQAVRSVAAIGRKVILANCGGRKPSQA